MKFHFSIAVWGDSFIDVFDKIHLPSLMSPGNLPAFLDQYPIEYRIYTTSEDAEKIRALESYKKFSALIPTIFIEVNDIDFSDVEVSHRVFNDLMKKALADAEAEGAAIFMNNPDTCWGDGSFSHVAKLVGEGKKCILNSAIRCDKDAFIDEVYNTCELNKDGSLTIDNSTLAKVGYDNIHPYQKTTVWGQGDTSLMPSPIITEVGDEGYILNMAHMGTLCTISEKLNQDFETTTDGDYINRVFENNEDIHIISDCTDACVMELSDKTRYVNNIIHELPLNELQIAEYLLSTASWETYSLNNFRHDITYSWKGKNVELWNSVEKEISDRNELILNLRQGLMWVRELQRIGFDDKLLFFIQFIFTSTNFFQYIGNNKPRLLNLPTSENLLQLIDSQKDENKLRVLGSFLYSSITTLSTGYYDKYNAKDSFAMLQNKGCDTSLEDACEIERCYIDGDILRIHNQDAVEVEESDLSNALTLNKGSSCINNGINIELNQEKKVNNDTFKRKYLIAGIVAKFFLCFGYKRSFFLHLCRFFFTKKYFIDICMSTLKSSGLLKGAWYIACILFFVPIHFLRYFLIKIYNGYICKWLPALFYPKNPYHHDPSPTAIEINREVKDVDRGGVTEKLSLVFRTMPVNTDNIGSNANSLFSLANILAQQNHFTSSFVMAKLSSFILPGYQPVEGFLMDLQSSVELKKMLKI